MSFDTPIPPYNPPDPHATYVGSSCFDFLLIELVPMAYRLAAEQAAREEEWSRGLSGLSKRYSGGAAKGTSGASGAGNLDEEETREAVSFRLETLGYRVGLGVVERWVCAFLYGV